jgi:hypothetical protein
MVLLNEKRFLSEKEAYWETTYSEYFGRCELVEFPAKFLIELLDCCIEQFRVHLLAKKKLPPDMYFHSFGYDVVDRLEFLDETLLPEGGAVRLKINR